MLYGFEVDPPSCGSVASAVDSVVDVVCDGVVAVSYTHLDVYKRQHRSTVR